MEKIHAHQQHKFLVRYAAYVSLIAIIFLVSTIVYAGMYYHARAQSANVAAAMQTAPNSDLITAVGALVHLPDEQPTIMTVSDPTKLSDQPFFAEAAQGDKVLVYSGADKVILYRPSQDKIIAIGPLDQAQ